MQWGQYMVTQTIRHNWGVGMSLTINLPISFERVYICLTSARNNCEIVTGAELTTSTIVKLGYTNHSNNAQYLHSVMWLAIG